MERGKACRGVGLDGDGSSDSAVRVDRNWLRRRETARDRVAMKMLAQPRRRTD